MAHTISTDESIEPAGATGITNIPGPIQVEEIMDMVGAMDHESSRPDSSGNISIPLLDFDIVKGVDKTPGPSGRDSASLDNSRKVDGARGAVKPEAVDLMTFTDDHIHEETDTQRSISCHGYSAMPAPAYYNHNLDALVCFPNKPSVRMSIKDAHPTAQVDKDVKIINFIQEPASRSGYGREILNTNKKKQALHSKETEGLLTNPAKDGPDASSTILDAQVPGEPLASAAGPEYRSNQESATHSSRATSATCNLCRATFPTKSQMFRHIRKDHGGFKNATMNGHEAPSSFTTPKTANFRGKGEEKPEPRTAEEPSTGIEEQDMMCEETGKKFQDAVKAIRVWASGQRLVAQGFVDNQRFVTPFEQLDLQSSVDKAEELVKIGKRLSGWVEEMVRNGIRRRALQKDQESIEREEKAGNELAKGKEKEQEAQQLELELDLDLDQVTDPNNGVCEDLIDLNYD